MPTTPHYALPYPTPADPVALGANDIRALAEKVDPTLPKLVTPAQLAGLVPVPGMQVRLLVDAAQGTQWHLVRNSGGWWDYIGGPALQGYEATLVALTVGAFSYIGPYIAVPVTGAYRVQASCTLTAAAGRQAYILPGIGGVASSGIAGHSIPGVLANAQLTAVSPMNTLSLTAGQTVGFGAQTNGACNCTNRFLSIVPLWLG